MNAISNVKYIGRVFTLGQTGFSAEAARRQAEDGPAQIKAPRTVIRGEKALTLKGAQPRELLTVEQFATRWPAWSKGALRSLILNSADRLSSRGDQIEGNGLARAGAIVRVGRRVLLDPQAFFLWIDEQQKRLNAKAQRQTHT